MNIPHSVTSTEIASRQINKIYPQPNTKLAPCIANCPNNTDIRGWINLIAQRERFGLSLKQALQQAWMKLVTFNPLPATLGRICPHTCEYQCNRKDKEGTLAVHLLERYLGDWGLQQNLQLPVLNSAPKSVSIGVIGAGPAGLSFAYQMVRRGYSVSVYEQYSKAGGMLRYGIPHYRLPTEILDGEIASISALGINFYFNTLVGRDINLATLRARHAEIFIGVGAHKPRILNIPFETRCCIISGIEFLRQVNQGENFVLGSHVVVIGGGNTAIDSARKALRAGAAVTLLYRRTQQDMPANADEIEEAMQEGVIFKFLSIVVEIRSSTKNNLQLLVQKLRVMEGTIIEPILDAIYELSASYVIVAISQHPDWGYLEELASSTEFLSINAIGQTASGMWTGGDSLRMGTVVQAISDGKRAAENLDAKLNGYTLPETTVVLPIKSDNLRLEYYANCVPVQENIRPQANWLTEPDTEIHLGLTEEQFLTEISRCLSCGSCYGCQLCWMYCNGKAYDWNQNATPGTYFNFISEVCEGCGKCVELCPTGFLR